MERIPPKTSKQLGRPSGFRPEFIDQARKLCLLSATDVEIANFFGIDVVTLNRWKKSYPALMQALKEGKETADAQVGQRLFERACGYTHPEEKIFLQEGEVIRVNTLKHYPPDTTACIFWLKNRRPEQWRDRQELTGLNGQPLTTTPPPLVINFFTGKRPGDDAKLIEAKPA